MFPDKWSAFVWKKHLLHCMFFCFQRKIKIFWGDDGLLSDCCQVIQSNHLTIYVMRQNMDKLKFMSAFWTAAMLWSVNLLPTEKEINKYFVALRLLSLQDGGEKQLQVWKSTLMMLRSEPAIISWMLWGIFQEKVTWINLWNLGSFCCYNKM